MLAGPDDDMSRKVVSMTELPALRGQTSRFALGPDEARGLKPAQIALSKAGQPPLGKEFLPLVQL